jgi:hypothetical protein
MLIVNTATVTGPRSMHAICELIQLAACDCCRAAGPEWPCTSSEGGPDGFHIARFAAARGRGLITAADFAAVIQAAGVFGNATVVYDDTLGGGAR